MLGAQADTPSSMNRQGAARAYHTYMNWGYFQRRMSVQQESQGSSEDGSLEEAEVAPDRTCEDAASSALPSNSDSHRSYAGAHSYVARLMPATTDWCEQESLKDLQDAWLITDSQDCAHCCKQLLV